MITIDIRKHLIAISDDNLKLQFLQDIMQHCQNLANLIQIRHQSPFVEVIVDKTTEDVVQCEQVNEVPNGEENATISK